MGKNAEQVMFARALGGLDWTKSIALHHTVWKWASANFYATVLTVLKEGKSIPEDNAAIGINLSADVYDIEGASQENAIWINGQVYIVGGVKFIIPAQADTDEWQIQSKDPTESEYIDLRFQPTGARQDHTDLYLLKSDFIQPFGYFYGNILVTASDGSMRSIHVQHAFGVVEDHNAAW